MKKTLLFCGLAATMLLAACSSNKSTAQNNGAKSPFGETFEAPCFQQAQDSETEFGGLGIVKGSSNQMGELHRSALNNAKAVIRDKVHSAYKGLESEYRQRHGNNAGNDLAVKEAGAVDRVVDMVLNDATETCMRYSSVDDRGQVTCYVAIKISKAELAKKVADKVADNLTADEKMRIDFNEKKYREEMESRLSKFKDNQ